MANEELNLRQTYLRTGLVLWIAAVFGAICVMPYAFGLAGNSLEDVAAKSGLAPLSLIAISIFQSALFLGAMTFVGLWASRKLGLGAPLIDARLSGRDLPDKLRTSVAQAVAIGLACAAVIVVLDQSVFIRMDPEGLGTLGSIHPAPWKGFLASFYGGIAEEIQLRLFFLSLLALGLRQLARLVNPDDSNLLPGWIFWTANTIAAIVFGLGHLPATAALLPITGLIIVRAVVLNGLIAIPLGVLFRRNGIEIAMIAHFSADIGLHVILPLLAA